jgi:hypothetical protein
MTQRPIFKESALAWTTPQTAHAIGSLTLNLRAVRSHTPHREFFWLLGVILLLAFSLADLATIGFASGTVGGDTLTAVVFSFALVAGGSLFTAWRFGNR